MAVKAPVGWVYNMPLRAGPCKVEVVEVWFLEGYDVPVLRFRTSKQVLLCCVGFCYVLLPDAEVSCILVYIHWMGGRGVGLGSFWLSLCWVEILEV